MRKLYFLDFATIGWAIVVAVVLTLPGEATPEMPGQFDKIGHFALFWVLGSLLARTCRKFHRSSAFSRLIAFLFCLAYDLLLEGVQLWIPGRAFDLLDIVAGAVGAAAGLLLSFAGRQRRSGAA